MHTRALLLLVAATPLLLAGSACNIVGPTACTLIGCFDGIDVEVAGDVDGPFRIEVVLPDGSVMTRECEAQSECFTLFEGVRAEEVTIRVVTDAGTSEETVRPSYTRSQPNGPRCPPVCYHATVVVAAPQGAVPRGF